jgi:hypothetical protein
MTGHGEFSPGNMADHEMIRCLPIISQTAARRTGTFLRTSAEVGQTWRLGALGFFVGTFARVSRAKLRFCGLRLFEA